MRKNILLYWSIPIILFITQLFFTINSTNQIRYEELAESVRNVYWLQNRTIYDGVSSNIGWYGTLLVLYNIFGFALNEAKIFRLVLQFISLFCLAAFLKKYLGEKIAWLPFLTIGLSPTLLYFNTLQTSYGMDLQYLPIILYLISSFKNHRLNIVKQFSLGLLVMVAWMSYPTMIFYFPALLVYYFYQTRQNLISLAGALAGFLLPLMVAMLYLKDWNLLLFDEKVKSGIFRGAGQFYLSWSNFWFNFSHTLNDLFISANSYYFEINWVEFSQFLPLLTFLIVIVFSIAITFKIKTYRFYLLSIWLVFIFTIIVSNLTFDPSGFPGLRRSTPVLTAFYSLYTFCWFVVQKRKWSNVVLRQTLIVILLFLPLHHAVAYPINLSNIKNPSNYQYKHIFSLTDTPNQSLDLLINSIQKEDLKFACKDKSDRIITCRYVEGYAAVAGFCLWNHLDCYGIYGYDGKSKKYIPLTIKLWEEYYWSH